MKTNQWLSSPDNSDGSMMFYNFNNGAPLYVEDGGYGLMLFYE